MTTPPITFTSRTRLTYAVVVRGCRVVVAGSLNGPKH